MKRIIVSMAAFILGSAVVAPSVHAASNIDALASCLADSTTGKDRKNMARWVFAGMSTHPDIMSLSNVKPSDRKEMDKTLAALFTRLMTENCPDQAKAVLEKEGPKGFEAAFAIIGKLAMQELMSDPNVNASFSNFVQYLDKGKIESVFSTKKKE
jgi:hypothetical protein